MRQHATQPFGLRLDLALRAGQEAQGGQALRQEFRRAVQAQHGLQRGQRQLADAQGALERILLDLADQVGAAHQQAGLRAAQQLVAAEGHQISARGDGFAHRVFLGQAALGQVHERAAAQVHRGRQPFRVRQRRPLVHADAFGETGDGVVAAMHLHQHRRARADGVVVVGGVRAVGGAHFHQLGARALHDVGDTKRAADLDQFTARHHDLAPVGQRVEHQQDGGGVVIDDGRGLGAGQLAGVVSARSTDATASSGSSARPRLVCNTVPVRL
ncbi:hypothetical protein G6F22_014217 [Rhizopus arrhizus]|nr:hypothetical protein G6F22_014217 [Rhizopus arrhizus]